MTGFLDQNDDAFCDLNGTFSGDELNGEEGYGDDKYAHLARQLNDNDPTLNEILNDPKINDKGKSSQKAPQKRFFRNMVQRDSLSNIRNFLNQGPANTPRSIPQHALDNRGTLSNIRDFLNG